MVRKQLNIGDQQDTFITKYMKEYDVGYTEALRRILDIGIGRLETVTNVHNTFHLSGNNKVNTESIASYVKESMNKRERRLRTAMYNASPITENKS